MTAWKRELRSVAIALGCVLLVRTVVAEPYTVPSGSMLPTLLVGDELIGAKYPYGWGKYSSPIGLMPDFAGRLFGHVPERGDVVVFRLPRDPGETYVKRVIGLPGERIQMRQGRLYIDDQPVPRREVGRWGDDRLFLETLPGGREHEIVEISDAQAGDDTPVFVVPAGHFFMMGDNRDNSVDSRIAPTDGGVGFVPAENLVARVDRLLLSRDPSVGWLDVGAWPRAFRLSRFLGRID
jgi:signal peptidase I